MGRNLFEAPSPDVPVTWKGPRFHPHEKGYLEVHQVLNGKMHIHAFSADDAKNDAAYYSPFGSTKDGPADPSNLNATSMGKHEGVQGYLVTQKK